MVDSIINKLVTMKHALVKYFHYLRDPTFFRPYEEGAKISKMGCRLQYLIANEKLNPKVVKCMVFYLQLISNTFRMERIKVGYKRTNPAP